MSIDTWIALAGLVFGGGVINQIFQVIRYRRSKPKKIETIVEAVMKALSMDQQGVYIPGMSEDKSKQLRDKIRKILTEHF